MGIDPKLAVQVYKRDSYKCRFCNSRTGLHPHHLIYKSQQGEDSLVNLLTLCYICHNAHHDGFLDIVFDEEVGGNGKVYFTTKRGWKPGGLGNRRESFRMSDLEAIVTRVMEDK